MRHVSTRSRAKAAGASRTKPEVVAVFQLAAARRRLEAAQDQFNAMQKFQLAAARRRLAAVEGWTHVPDTVSTRSRAKAAGASAETLAQQGLHRPVSLRFHQKHMALL